MSPWVLIDLCVYLLYSVFIYEVKYFIIIMLKTKLEIWTNYWCWSPGLWRRVDSGRYKRFEGTCYIRLEACSPFHNPEDQHHHYLIRTEDLIFQLTVFHWYKCIVQIASNYYQFLVGRNYGTYNLFFGCCGNYSANTQLRQLILKLPQELEY